MKAANPELEHKHAFGQAARNTKLHLLEQTRAAAREAADAITALGSKPAVGTEAPSQDVEVQAGLDLQPVLPPVAVRPPVRRAQSRRIQGRAHPYCRT